MSKRTNYIRTHLVDSPDNLPSGVLILPVPFNGTPTDSDELVRFVYQDENKDWQTFGSVKKNTVAFQEGTNISPDAGDLDLSTNGDINLTAASGININATEGVISIVADSVSDKALNINVNNNGAGNADFSLAVDREIDFNAYNLDINMSDNVAVNGTSIQLAGTASSSFVVSGSSSSLLTMSMQCINNGSGDGSLNLYATDEIDLSATTLDFNATDNCSLVLTTNDTGDHTMVVRSINSGSGGGHLDLQADNNVNIIAGGGLNVDVSGNITVDGLGATSALSANIYSILIDSQNTSYFKTTCDDSADKNLTLQCTNAGTGLGYLNIIADDNIYVQSLNADLRLAALNAEARISSTTFDVSATGAVTVSGSSVIIDTTGTLDVNANTGINLDTYLTLVDTTADDEGVIYKGTTRFLHNFQHPTGSSSIPEGKNTFLGIDCGNFTMGSTATEYWHGSDNTAIGYESLLSNVLGYYNTAIGVGSLYSNTDGGSNSAQGVNSLRSNTTGYNNSAQGVDTLRSNVDGYYNTAQGVSALYSNVDGYGNTAQGVGALQENTSGYYNNAHGVSALQSNTTGYYNVAHGVNSGRLVAGGVDPNETSNTSVYLGANTKAYADGQSNEIVIGYDTTGSGTNTVVLGNDSITETYLKGHISTEGRRSAVTVVNAATYDLAAGDEILHVTYSGVTVTLTTAQTENGRKIYIKDAAGTASAGNITVDTEGSEKIDGQDTLTIDTDYGKETLYSNGSNWFTL